MPDEVLVGRPGRTAYFQRVEDNLSQIAAGNLDAVRAEAEQQHKEIMQMEIWRCSGVSASRR